MVGLMAFPGLTTSAQAAYEYDCASSPAPAIANYNQTSPGPPVYQIVNFASDYRTSDTSTALVSTSNLVKAARAGATGCQQGIQAVGGPGTYFADAITAAQTALVSQQTTRKSQGVTSTNVIVLISDGQASSSSAPASQKNTQCSAAANAAIAAAQNGTWVYSVAYGATSSGCTDSNSSYKSSCYTMQQIANSLGNYPDANKFYSDQIGAGGCSSAAHPVSTLDQIFKSIAGDLTVARLLPNGTT
jgi:hypothetical protein